MDAEVFVRSFGAVFGLVAGGGVVGLALKVGVSWGTIRRDVSDTKSAVGRIEPVVTEHAKSLQAINQTLHGPEGGNGLYGTVRKLDERFDEIERQLLTRPKPRRASL